MGVPVPGSTGSSHWYHVYPLKATVSILSDLPHAFRACFFVMPTLRPPIEVPVTILWFLNLGMWADAAPAATRARDSTASRASKRDALRIICPPVSVRVGATLTPHAKRVIGLRSGSPRGRWPVAGLYPAAPMATFDSLASLPVEIDGYSLEGLEANVSSEFTRLSTVIRISGGGEEGVG